MKKSGFTPLAFIYLIMRVSTLAFFVLVITGSVVSASVGRAQTIEDTRINVDFANVSLGEALSQIKSQSGFGFVYNSSLNVRKRVTIRASNISVASVLSMLLHDTNFVFRQDGNNVLFSRKPRQVVAGQIQGKIIDEQSGDVLVGANVVLEGTTLGVSADVNGVFRFANVAPVLILWWHPSLATSRSAWRTCWLLKATHRW